MSKNGGPAFPCVYVKHAPGEVGNNVAIKEHGEGVTVRDYFAAKAMQAMISNGLETRAECKAIPSAAYAFADAMLEERNK